MLNKWALGACCCGEEEWPVCGDEFLLPTVLNFTDSILGSGTGTHLTGGEWDKGFGYWEGTLVVDFPGTGPESPCSECPPQADVVVTYRLIPALLVTGDCGFEVWISVSVDELQLCLEPGPFTSENATDCNYDTTPLMGGTYTFPPAFTVTGSPACAGSSYIVLVHGCDSTFDITWFQ